MKALTLLLASLTITSAMADITIVNETLLNGVGSKSTMWIKGDKVRTDNDTTTTTIIDTASGDMTTLMHEQKMIIKMNTKQLQELAKQAPGASTPEASQTKVTATGEKEKVDGYDCEIYLSENMGMTVKMWVAKSYPNGDKLREEMKVMAKLGTPGAPQQPEVPGIAIKTEFVQQGMKFTTRLVSIKTDSIDDSRFAIPTDYKAP
jgi:hypothetical protein